MNKLAISLPDKQKHKTVTQSAVPQFSFKNTDSKCTSHRNLAGFLRWLYFSAKRPPTETTTQFPQPTVGFASQDSNKKPPKTAKTAWLKQPGQHATPAMLSVLSLRKPAWLRFAWNICISLFYRSGFQIKETDFQRQSLFLATLLGKVSKQSCKLASKWK